MPDRPAAAARSLPLNLLLAATTLLSAWLLFQVQPMVAKRILPWFGGGAAVWTATMLFFQAALLVGYLYAHLVARSLSPRRQAALHLALLAIAAALVVAVGVVPSNRWQPAPTDPPLAGILLMLAATVGLPYLVLAATAPLVQVWFSRANPGRSPYRLYAVSNLGSLAALLSYPLAIEPQIGLRRQAAAWSALFVAFAAACAASALLALGRRAPFAPAAGEPPDDETPRAQPSSRGSYFLWIALPACASALLLAITAYITQQIAPIPLLWILPMVVYLVSFILTFDSDRWYVRPLWMPLAAAASLAAVYTWHTQRMPDIPYLVGLHLALLLAACMVCHGELARRRPSAPQLTAFYLCIAAGGALGGVFVGVVAPLVFADHYELHLGLLAAWLLAIGVLLTDRTSPFYDGGRRGSFAAVLGMAGLLVVLVVMLGVQISQRRADAIELARGFHGALLVSEELSDEDVAYRRLTNGHVAHGGQFVTENNRRVPMWYYHAQSGIGETLLKLKPAPPRRVGVVGLGPGTLAAYAESGDFFQFYDVNAQVIELAGRAFTFLEDARQRGATVEIVEGDARLVLERQEPQAFDVLVVDAFNGDAVPVHLLTQEAFEQYLRHLDDDGVLAIHITNTYLALDAVVKAAADRFDLDAAFFKTPADMSPGASAATWVLLHRERGYFAARRFGEPLGGPQRPVAPVAWTDDYSNVVEILKW